ESVFINKILAQIGRRQRSALALPRRAAMPSISSPGLFRQMTEQRPHVGERDEIYHVGIVSDRDHFVEAEGAM
ncbi:MAG: hypothetical protein WBW35_22405, partial [Xanthobacteraceae bacterium]